MYPNELVLRCYAEQLENTRWLVVCVDLPLNADGDGFVDAHAKLEGLIHQYVVDVLCRQAPEETAEKFTPRRLLLISRLKYRCFKVLRTLGVHPRKILFEIVLPLIPAPR